MDFNRVLPRDLFNESKLLKCLGQLTLKIHDCELQGVSFYHDDIRYSGFDVVLSDDGHLSVSNLIFTKNDTRLHFHTPYNSKEPYPLYLYMDYVEYPVFTESGSLHEEFLEALTDV